jgi:hypothetical protein
MGYQDNVNTVATLTAQPATGPSAADLAAIAAELKQAQDTLSGNKGGVVQPTTDGTVWDAINSINARLELFNRRSGQRI